MTDAVKLAGNATPAVQGGQGRSRDKSDQGGFEMLFRLAAKSAKADAPRADTAGKQPVAGWDVLARLEAAIAVKTGALRADETDVPPADPAESDQDERDPEGVTDLPVPTASGTVQATRDDDTRKAAPEAKGSGDADETIVAKRAPAHEGEAKTARVNTSAAQQGAEPKAQTMEAASAATSASVQATGTTKPEGKGADFVTFVPSAKTASVAGASGSESQGAGLRDKRSNGGAPAPKVAVLEQQSIVAPAMTTPPTTSALVAGLTGDSGWQNSMRSVAASQHLAAQIGTAPLHTMKLQLHPAELGMVTANLRFSGDQLQVELRVENQEAYDRLTGDSEAIVKSLRALGYEIDQVSVQQPQIANNTSGRAETNFGSLGNQARDAQAFGQQGQGGGDRLGGQGSGRGERNAGGRDGGNAQAAQDNTQRGIYI
jgi:chemotaxis protein MotD